MAKIHYLSDANGKFYPMAHASATYDKNGITVETRLDSIESSIPTDLSDLTEDEDHRFVTDAEKEAWDAKQTSLTTVQMNAIDSGITATKVSTYDEYATTKANIDSPSLTGIPTAPTAETGTTTVQIATTEFVQQEIANSRHTLTFGKYSYNGSEDVHVDMYGGIYYSN